MIEDDRGTVDNVDDDRDGDVEWQSTCATRGSR